MKKRTLWVAAFDLIDELEQIRDGYDHSLWEKHRYEAALEAIIDAFMMQRREEVNELVEAIYRQRIADTGLAGRLVLDAGDSRESAGSTDVHNDTAVRGRQGTVGPGEVGDEGGCRRDRLRGPSSGVGPTYRLLRRGSGGVALRPEHERSRELDFPDLGAKPGKADEVD